jgi:hypothetical protein
VVDVTENRPALDPNHVLLRLDQSAAHLGQVDDERVVGHAEAAGVVTATAHGNGKGMGRGETHGSDNVGSVLAAHQRGRPAVDHPVVDSAGSVVLLIVGPDDAAAQLSPELLERRSVN